MKPTLAHALSNFRRTYTDFLNSAETLRATLEAEVGEIGHLPQDIATIVKLVGARFGVTSGQLLSRRRTAQVGRARLVAIALALETTPHTACAVTGYFSRDHSLAAYAQKTVANLCATDAAFAAEVAALRDAVPTKTVRFAA
jgi:chromosomal replication initiation ATPase DnaA